MKKAETQKLLTELAAVIAENNVIPQELYEKNNVKRGLRNANGTGSPGWDHPCRPMSSVTKKNGGRQNPGPRPVVLSRDQYF